VPVHLHQTIHNKQLASISLLEKVMVTLRTINPNQWGAFQNFRWLAQVARTNVVPTTTTVATTTTPQTTTTTPQTTSTLATTTTIPQTTSTLATTTTVPQTTSTTTTQAPPTTQPPPTTSTLASTTVQTTQPPNGICSASSVNPGVPCSDAVIDCGCPAPAEESLLPWTRRDLQTCAQANKSCSSGRNGTPCCPGAGTCESIRGGQKECTGGVPTTTVPPVTTQVTTSEYS